MFYIYKNKNLLKQNMYYYREARRGGPEEGGELGVVEFGKILGLQLPPPDFCQSRLFKN